MKVLGRLPISQGERATIVGWAGLAALTLCAFILYLLRYVVLPFAVAAAFAYLAAPLVRALQRRRWPHWTAALAAYVLYLAVFAVLAVLGRVAIVPEVATLAATAPENLHRLLVDAFHRESLSVFGQTLDATTLSGYAVSRIGATLRDPATIFGFAAYGFTALTVFFLTVALLGYFLFQGPRFKRGMLWLVPPRFRPLAATLAHDAGPVIYNYVRGLLIIVAYATIVTWLIMGLFVQLPGAGVVSVAVGLLEMVPLFGPILSMVLIGLVAAAHATTGTIVTFALFVTALRVSIDNFVAPMVLGRAVKLPAPVIIFAFLAGAALYGPVGALVAIPVAAIAKTVLAEAYAEHETGTEPQPLTRRVEAR